MNGHVALSALTAAFVFACSGSENSPEAANDASVAPATQSTLTAPGPYQVATFEQTFVDSSRSTPANGTYSGAPDRTLVTKVWYPTRDGTTAASDGPFPVIAYGHGFTSDRNEAAALKSHLTSHGYVVIAPDFPLSSGQAPGGPTIADMANQPGDLAFVVAQVEALTGEHSDVAKAMDLARQGVAGLSLGGATTLIAVYHPVLYLEKVKAAVAFAPLSCAFGQAMYVHAVPTLILSGSSDELVPFDTIATRPQAWAPPPLQVGKLVGGTHMGFTGLDLGDGGNSDEVGCGIVQNAFGGPIPDPATLQPTIDALNAGTDGGIADLAACGAICPTKYIQTMSATRQLELTRAATLAHFDAVLRGKKDDDAYLATSFDADNDDVEVTRAR